MKDPTRVVLPVLMSGIMVLVVTLVVTLQTFGLHAGFVARWMGAYFLAWPVAAVTGVFCLPVVQRLSALIVRGLGSGAIRP